MYSGTKRRRVNASHCVGRDQFCVGMTGLCRQKVPTFGCRADMSPTCWRHCQPDGNGGLCYIKTQQLGDAWYNFLVHERGQQQRNGQGQSYLRRKSFWIYPFGNKNKSSHGIQNIRKGNAQHQESSKTWGHHHNNIIIHMIWFGWYLFLLLISSNISIEV